MSGGSSQVLRANARERGRWRDEIFSPAGPKNAQAKLVALAVESHINTETMVTIVGAATIAKETALGERTVRDRINELITGGYLKAQAVGHGRQWKIRELRLGWPAQRAGHEQVRPAQRACHEAWRPANGASMTGSAPLHDRHGVPPNLLGDPKETPGAASPRPADADEAAPPTKPAVVGALKATPEMAREKLREISRALRAGGAQPTTGRRQQR